MPKHGKKYRDGLAQFDRDTLYTPADAIKLIKNIAPAKFDETVELHTLLRKMGFDIDRSSIEIAPVPDQKQALRRELGGHQTGHEPTTNLQSVKYDVRFGD